MSELIRVHVAESGRSAFAVDISVRGHVIVGDEPESEGGGDLGPSPFELLTAALGECTALTVRWFARRKGWALDHVAVDVTHEKGTVEGRAGQVDIFRKRVTITGEALSDEEREALLDIAAKCPVHRTLAVGSEITTLPGW